MKHTIQDDFEVDENILNVLKEGYKNIHKRLKEKEFGLYSETEASIQTYINGLRDGVRLEKMRANKNK